MIGGYCLLIRIEHYHLTRHGFCQKQRYREHDVFLWAHLRPRSRKRRSGKPPKPAFKGLFQPLKSIQNRSKSMRDHKEKHYSQASSSSLLEDLLKGLREAQSDGYGVHRNLVRRPIEGDGSEGLRQAADPQQVDAEACAARVDDAHQRGAQVAGQCGHAEEHRGGLAWRTSRCFSSKMMENRPLKGGTQACLAGKSMRRALGSVARMQIRSTCLIKIAFGELPLTEDRTASCRRESDGLSHASPKTRSRK